jgi:hypothetical protein
MLKVSLPCPFFAVIVSYLFAISPAMAAEKPNICESRLIHEGLESPHFKAYFDIMTAMDLNQGEIDVEIKAGVTDKALTEFLPGVTRLDLANDFQVETSFDNRQEFATVDFKLQGRPLSSLKFPKALYLWTRKTDADLEELEWTEAINFIKFGMIAPSTDPSVSRRYISIKNIKDKKKTVTIGIDVPCNVVFDFTNDPTSVRKVNVLSEGQGVELLHPGTTLREERCRVPVFKMKMKYRSRGGGGSIIPV